ncbi:MAG: DUF4286 family protein [Pyrinomonadaceae bacterium]
MQAISYEITAIVRGDLTAKFESYMTERHIPDVIATGAFESSTFLRSGEGRYRISYLTSREGLDGYLREQAPALRAHVAESFPEGVEISREEWEVLSVFTE